MEIFKAGKIGMGFFGGLIFGPGNFLGFDCCPAIWSFPSPEIWSTPTPTPREMNYVVYNVCGIVSYPCYHLNAIADDDDPDTTHLYAEYRLPSTQSFALIGGYWLDPSKQVTIVSLSGSWNKANDRLGTLRLISSSGISTRWTFFFFERKKNGLKAEVEKLSFNKCLQIFLKLGGNAFPILLKIQGVSGRLLSKTFLKYSRSWVTEKKKKKTLLV